MRLGILCMQPGIFCMHSGRYFLHYLIYPGLFPVFTGSYSMICFKGSGKISNMPVATFTGYRFYSITINLQQAGSKFHSLLQEIGKKAQPIILAE